MTDRADADAGPLLRALVATSAALIVAFDAAGAIVFANAAVEAFTGRPRADLLGQPVERVLIASSGATAWRERRPGDVPVRARAGAERVVEWRFGAAPGEAGHAIGFDVTDARAHERLAHRAEQLAAAGELTAGLAHEVRNPLNAALLELAVLRRRVARVGDQASLASAHVVARELARLERLLGEFLELAPQAASSRSLGDLSRPALAAARLVAPDAAARGIALELDLARDLPRTHHDDERIRRLAINLLRNAVEALDRGGRIVVRTRACEDRVELSVEDDGPGIAGEPARVFRAFHTTKPTATGLGLAIAQRIASEHGGELRVESGPGRTVFTLALPAVPPTA